MNNKKCPDCNNPMRLESETDLERVWVCDYCGLGANVVS